MRNRNSDSHVISERPLQRQHTERAEPRTAHHNKGAGQHVPSQVRNKKKNTHTRDELEKNTFQWDLVALFNFGDNLLSK